MQVRDLISRIFHHTILKIGFLLYDTEGSRSQTSWQSNESVLWNPAVLVSNFFSVPQFCLYQLASICKKVPNSLKARRVLRVVHLEQVDLQKRVLMYQ